jgi:hypothetical protein
MAKLMKSDRFDPSKAYCSPESVPNVTYVTFGLSRDLKSFWRRENPFAVFLPEKCKQLLAQHGVQVHIAALSGLSLRLLNDQYVLLEVDVSPAKSKNFTSSQPGVERNQDDRG